VRSAVIGSEPEIYFTARRRAATGHIYMYPLVEQHALAMAMQPQMISEIQTNQPEYVVYVNDDISWLTSSRMPRQVLDWWKAYWRSNLNPEKIIYILKTDASGGHQEQALNLSKDPKAIIILRRKTGPASTNTNSPASEKF